MRIMSTQQPETDRWGPDKNRGYDPGFPSNGDSMMHGGPQPIGGDMRGPVDFNRGGPPQDFRGGGGHGPGDFRNGSQGDFRGPGGDMRGGPPNDFRGGPGLDPRGGAPPADFRGPMPSDPRGPPSYLRGAPPGPGGPGGGSGPGMGGPMGGPGGGGIRGDNRDTRQMDPRGDTRQMDPRGAPPNLSGSGGGIGGLHHSRVHQHTHTLCHMRMWCGNRTLVHQRVRTG